MSLESKWPTGQCRLSLIETFMTKWQQSCMKPAWMPKQGWQASTCAKQKKISQKTLPAGSCNCRKSKRCKDKQITENIQEQRIWGCCLLNKQVWFLGRWCNVLDLFVKFLAWQAQQIEDNDEIVALIKMWFCWSATPQAVGHVQSNNTEQCSQLHVTDQFQFILSCTIKATIQLWKHPWVHTGQVELLSKFKTWKLFMQNCHSFQSCSAFFSPVLSKWTNVGDSWFLIIARNIVVLWPCIQHLQTNLFSRKAKLKTFACMHVVFAFWPASWNCWVADSASHQFVEMLSHQDIGAPAGNWNFCREQFRLIIFENLMCVEHCQQLIGNSQFHASVNKLKCNQTQTIKQRHVFAHANKVRNNRWSLNGQFTVSTIFEAFHVIDCQMFIPKLHSQLMSRHFLLLRTIFHPSISGWCAVHAANG